MRRARSATEPVDRLRAHRYGALVAPLREDASFLAKPMFGCLACYLHGRLMLLLADRREPWRGLLVPTAVEHHAALRAELPVLRVHPVLGKWLRLAESDDDFEATAARLVALAAADDPRIGVEPSPRARRRRRR
jgi:hypothetical protein